MGWIDQTMADLYKAALDRPEAHRDAVRASQRARLKQRDRCTGSNAEVMNCLEESYCARFAEMAAPTTRAA